MKIVRNMGLLQLTDSFVYLTNVHKTMSIYFDVTIVR